MVEIEEMMRCKIYSMNRMQTAHKDIEVLVFVNFLGLNLSGFSLEI